MPKFEHIHAQHWNRKLIRKTEILVTILVKSSTISMSNLVRSSENSLLVFLSWLLLGVLSAVAIAIVPTSALLNLFHDDSFFYMVIARNHTAGLGYSFDGLNLTNGFHPLWLWLLSLVGSQVSIVGEQGIRAVVLLQSILSIGAALLYVHLLALVKVRRFILVTFYFTYLFLCTFADIGQESALLGLLIALLVHQIFSVGPYSLHNVPPSESQDRTLSQVRKEALKTPGFKYWFSILVLGTLIILARLDSFFILGGICLAMYVSDQKKGALALGVGLLVGISITIIFNYVNFGHIYSVSSWLKSGFDLDKLRQLLIPGLAVRISIVLGLLVAALYHYRTYLKQYLNTKSGNGKSEHDFSALHNINGMTLPVALTLGALLVYSTYFVVLLVQVSALGSWYFNQAMGLALFLYALSTAAPQQNQAHSSKVDVLLAMPLALALVIGASLWGIKIGWANSSDPTKEVGEWLAANTPVDAVIFQRDGAGAVSYFARRHIINGDGLVNNMPYQVMLRSGKLCQYLQDQKVQYLVTNVFVNSAGNLQDFIYLWTKGVDSIPLTNVSPSKALYASPSAPTYRVFRISDAASYCP